MRLAAVIVRGLIVLLFAYYIAAFLWSVAIRVTYPYELDYFEGSTYLHTQRIIDGEGLYVNPDEGFIPYPYTPLYYYATIPFTWIFGQGIIAGRFCTLAALIAIGWFIWRALFSETKSRMAGLFTFGIFLSLYYILGAWFDVCRIDVFLCAMLIGSVFFLKDFPSKRSGLIPSAAFLVAAVFTKQVAIVYLIFIFPFIYTRDKRAACFYFLGILISVAVITAIANAATGGWFLHYIYDVPQHRQFSSSLFVNQFLVEDVAGKIPILFVGSILWMFIRNKVAGKRTPLNIWEWTLPAALLASALPRSQPGGFENNLLPFALWCSIMFGFTFYHLPKYFERLIGSADTADRKRHWAALRVIAYNFLLAQLIFIFFIPTAKAFPRSTDYTIIPTAEDRRAGDNLIAYLKSFPGEVYLPVHNYYGWLAGKTSTLILSSVVEHLEAGGAQPITFYEQLQEHHFDAIIANEIFMPRSIALSYERAILDDYYWAGDVQWGSRNVFLPVTGLRTRPDVVMLPLDRLAGVDERVAGNPVRFVRNGDVLFACLTSEGNLLIVDPIEFTSEKIELHLGGATLIDATDDGTLALLVGNSVFMLDGEGYKEVPLPELQSPVGNGQMAIDPNGRFIAVADYDGGILYVIDIPTGDVLEKINVGRFPQQVTISRDGTNLYLKTVIRFKLSTREIGLVDLQRFAISSEGDIIHIQLECKEEHPIYLGVEMKLSPDGKYIFWFNPSLFDHVNVYDADSLEYLYSLRGWGWCVKDIKFGDDPSKIYLHYTRPQYNGVAIINLDATEEFGQAKIYDKSGGIALVPGTDDEVILFSRGTKRIVRFKIYPKGSWPGEQGFSPD